MKEERIIFHIDVNNAFLSWTAVDMLRRGATEDIRNIPSVIGGDEDARRGIVVAKSPVAKKYGVILLLKGHETIVTDGNITYLVDVGSPGMATAGSGDVLSGILAGFLGYNECNVLSVAAGAYLTGLAGSLATKKYTDIAMIASDTIKYIPDAIKIIRGTNEKN